MGDFNRGSTGPGRGRSLARMPEVSAGEGASGNVIPRGTTKASVRRGQALLRILNDRAADGQTFSRGSNKSGRRRNFSMMAGLSAAATGTGVKVTRGPVPIGGTTVNVDWTAEEYDYGDWWTTGALLTCPTAGAYSISYNLNQTSGAGGTTVQVYNNGTPISSITYGSGATNLAASVSAALVPGDVVRVQVDTSASVFILDGNLIIA